VLGFLKRVCIWFGSRHAYSMRDPRTDWPSGAAPALEVFFDGDCPLCTKEVNMIASKDSKSQIRFTDIAAPHFDAASRGFTQQQLMDEIRAVLPDGTCLSGVEVFRRMYSLIGFTRTVSLTRLWGVRHGLDAAYAVWAKNRLKLTGRCEGDVCHAPGAQ